MTTAGIPEGTLLSDEEIHARLKKDLKIYPLIDEETQIHGCKVDLRLGGVFYEIKHGGLVAFDPTEAPTYEYRRKVILPPWKPYILHPFVLVLAPTFENVAIPPDLLGMLQGRSSIARLGILVHATAGWIDPGYSGPITLEFSNLGYLPVPLYPLWRVASLAFHKISGHIQKPYGSEIASPINPSNSIRFGRYNSPVSEPSKLEQDWETEIFKNLKKQHGSTK